jgi:hypothetical protein
MIRRHFLRHLTATAAGLLVADDALELLTEPRRRYWPGADFGASARVITFEEFHRQVIRAIAAGLGISYAELVGSCGAISYSRLARRA